MNAGSNRTFSEENLLALVAASAGLYERVENRLRPRTGGPMDPMVARQLTAWRSMFEDSGTDVFVHRLAADGWTQASIAPYLGEVAPPDGYDPPQWALTLRGCVRAASRPSGSDQEGDGEPKPGQPFEDLLIPMVRFASAELCRRARDSCRLLSTAALDDAERFLLQQLAQVSVPTLTLEFQTFRSAGESTIFRMIRVANDQRSDTLYRTFIAGLRAGGLVELLSMYPVLGRFWGMTVESWISALTELLTRLDQDSPIIAGQLGTRSGGSVRRIRMGLSDPHHGGRMVALLVFAGDRRVVYKPKGLGLERAFSELLTWIDDHGSPVRLRAVEVVDRETHGWVEFVDHDDCLDAPALRSYFRRAGALLCLVHLLEGTDCHQENIVAAGEHPVLVDAEALLHHRVAPDRPSGSRDGDLQAREEYWSSVFRTGMLPNWILDESGTAVDTSGLGGFGEQVPQRRTPRWENLNTDELALAHLPHPARRDRNVPKLAGQPQPAIGFEDELIGGFAEMYRFCQQRKETLLSGDGPLVPLGPQISRFIPRDSALYGRLRNGLLQPLALTSGIAQMLRLEAIAVAQAATPINSGAWHAIRSEIEALLRLDFPYFCAAADSTHLDMPGGRQLEGFFGKSSFDQAMRKISDMGSDDLDKQIGYIRAAFFARSAQALHQWKPGATQHRHNGRIQPSVDVDDAFSDERFVAEAERIGHHLWSQAIRGDSGGAAWIGLEFQQRARRYRYQPIGHGFFSGRCGVGLFFAALWSVTGTVRWRDFALDTVEATRRAIAENPKTRNWPVAYADMAYALGRMGIMLGDDILVRDALKAADRIDHSAIEADEVLDVLFGAAGALLGFLSMHRELGDEGFLDKAVACGDQLLRGRVVTPSGQRAWSSQDCAALTGFSHGAAGGAYALLKLFEATGDDAYRTAALEAIEFERAVFDAGAGNWPDLRASNGPPRSRRFMTAWCNGATGIGLSRLVAKDLVADDTVRDEIEVALATTRRHTRQEADHLCCGNFGRIEFLLVAGTVTDRPDLVAEARQCAAARVRDSERNGGYDLMRRLPRWVGNPGFFQGSSGIGYELLRIAQPADLPILLLRE